MSARQPLKVMLDEDVVSRLKRAANRYGRKTGNVIAEEIIVDFLDTWIELEEMRKQKKQAMKDALLGEETYSPLRKAK